MGDTVVDFKGLIHARTTVTLDCLHVSPHLSRLITLTLCAVLSACAPNTPFPPEVMEIRRRDQNPAGRPDRPSYRGRQGHRDCRGATSHRELSCVWTQGTGTRYENRHL